MHRGRAVAICALIGALAFVGLRSSSTSSSTDRSETTTAAEAASTTEKRAQAPRGGAVTATTAAANGGGARLDPELDAKLTQRAERVSQAMALLRYAPGSQPLRADMKDVLQPNRRHETPLPLSMATGTAGANPKDPPKEGDLSFLFTGDVFTVIGRSPLTATLEVFREGPGQSGRRERVEVDVTGAEITVDGHAVASGLLPSDEGRDGDAIAGDKVYGVAIVPATIPALAAHRGVARLEVEFVARDGDRKPARAALDFRVSTVAPAVFTGVTNEQLTPDGLEISVGLQVDEPGRYFVQGLLFDANDAPIGFAVARPTLAAGRTTVPLLYWGLLFREANAAGPYTFKTVTGYRMPADNEPDRAEIATWAGPYRTRAYAATDFSDKEYESAAKEGKLKALADLAAHNPAKTAVSQ